MSIKKSPVMSSGFRKQFDELRASANDSGDTLYSIDIKPIYAEIFVWE